MNIRRTFKLYFLVLPTLLFGFSLLASSQSAESSHVQPPAEVLSRKSWFYHKGDTTVKTIAEIEVLLNEAARMEANLLLNVGPMENGKLRPEDIRILTDLQK